MTTPSITNKALVCLNNDKCRLILLSFLMLFVELALIRWAGSNIYLLSIFSNFILLASFLGIGIGFIRAKTANNLFPYAPICLALIIVFCYQYSYEYQVNIDKATDDLNYYGMLFKENLFPVWLSLPIIFLVVTTVMMTIADGVSRTFQRFPPLLAYRLEVIGSLLGIISFSLLSFLSASPLWWGVIISLLFISLLLTEWRVNKIMTLLQILSLFLIVFTLGKQTVMSNFLWSPYYKIAVQAYTHGRYAVNVNGVPQQFIESVEQRKKYKPFYFLPYQHNKEEKTLDKVLVIGAGTGGDVAIALAAGAKHVDAVEIDPLLYSLGKQLNPDHPYSDARVSVYINDGRAFLHQSPSLYDMIIFALPDSLMLMPGASSLRLENYLFTLEAITMAKRHLKPDGVLTLYNYYREQWMVDRLANTLATVFQHTPCLDTDGDNNHWLSVLTISANPSSLRCSSPWQLTESVYAKPSTDNHPFLYLKENRISMIYLLSLLFVFLTAHFMLKASAVSYRSIGKYLDLFFMGAAFLLLETKSIINFALLFGSTWFVNALVFIGILLTVFLAIEVTHRIKSVSSLMLYIALLASLLLAWLIPNDYLLSLPFYLRFATAVSLAFAPLFVANLIFANRFHQTINSTEAFGANLIGAVAGGLLEYSSMIVGYRHLIILIVILYTLAIIFMHALQKKSVVLSKG